MDAVTREFDADAHARRLQELLGYSIWPPFMGQVTASHPMKALREDFVAPALADRRSQS